MKGALDGAAFVEHSQRMAEHTRLVELSDLQQQFEGGFAVEEKQK
jgi:hypothetical protein